MELQAAMGHQTLQMLLRYSRMGGEQSRRFSEYADNFLKEENG